MSRKKNILTGILAGVLAMSLMFALAGCSTEADTGADDTATSVASEDAASTASDQETFEDVCTTCHDGTRVYLQPDGTDWSRVIDTMESAHGAILTDEEKASVQRYLEEYEQSTGEQIISGKCTACHDTANIYSQPSDTSWEDITQRMIDEHEAVLTPEEQQAVIDYLSNR